MLLATAPDMGLFRLNPAHLSSDLNVVRAYRENPPVHNGDMFPTGHRFVTVLLQPGFLLDTPGGFV
jgi:hypothetical protein